MTETLEASLGSESATDEAGSAVSPPVLASRSAKRGFLFERTVPLLAIFLLAGLAVFAATFLTVHNRPSEELLTNSGAQRSNLVISHWLNEGYFHYCGLTVRTALDEVSVYRSSTADTWLAPSSWRSSTWPVSAITVGG